MNSIKDMLKAGKTAIGTTASINSPVGFLADTEFDFILFDTQHSPVEIKELHPQIQVMKGKMPSPSFGLVPTTRTKSAMPST